ncbi:MAG: signal peptidase I [Bdellovibrionaceae bacterium]|nr:signal peptidase I [Pseudobdellovibrionaceae bacterium]|tara:strand:+ start:585 stop:1214 length:630 start_codon:yes stop_codon:yes gene_type:complete
MKNRKILKKNFKDYGSAVVLAVFFAMIIRTFFIEAFRIPNEVMTPTLQSGDLIFVSKWNYKDQLPKLGDVVVFKGTAHGDLHFVKRVLGLPGDTISIQKGRIIRNKKTLPFTAGEQATCGKENLEKLKYRICLEPPLFEMEEITIKKNHVFLVGDYRKFDVSQKDWAVVPHNLIVAKARWIWLSIDPDRSESTGLLPSFRLSRIFTPIL